MNKLIITYSFHLDHWNYFSDEILFAVQNYIKSPEGQEIIHGLLERAIEKKGGDLPPKWNVSIVPSVLEEEHWEELESKEFKVMVHLLDPRLSYKDRGENSIEIVVPMDSPVMYFPVPSWAQVHLDPVTSHPYRSGQFNLVSQEAIDELSKFIQELQKLKNRMIDAGRKRKASMTAPGM
jgi:hypothetical protein